MRILVSLLLLVFPIATFACGWEPSEDFFYNIMDQKSISAKDYYPFLRSDYEYFYSDYKESTYEDHKGNLDLWKTTLSTWSNADLMRALTTKSPNSYNKLWKGKTSSAELASKTYIDYARNCSNSFDYRSRRSWDYQEILKTKDIDPTNLLTEGIALFKSCENELLKMRYAYQIIRIFHYSGQHEDAVVFFQNNVVDQFPKNEMYYYILDQVAGCYYSLKDYEKAAYLFLKVFNNSMDRKKSAFTSYTFCTNNGAEGKSHFEETSDEVGFIAMKSLRSFSDEINGLHELFAIAPNDNKMELLFMRALNNTEREVLKTYIGMQDVKIPSVDGNQSNRITDLLNLTKKSLNSNEVDNKDFWRLSNSYLHFLANNIPQAKQQLLGVKKYKKQKAIFEHIYEVFSWSKMDPSKENYLEFITEKDLEYSSDRWDRPMPDWQGMILDQVAHLYYQNGEYAKAFLVHNPIEVIHDIFSLDLLDDLLDFNMQAPKNNFEQLLAKKLEKNELGITAQEYITYFKGIYYLQQGKSATALDYFNEVYASTGLRADDIIDNSISPRVFSNNVTECFNCPEENIMEDEVYLADVFNFIQDDFGKRELAEHLVKLDSLTKVELQWKQKLAHYLLGNYYFNITNTGYFRGTLSGKGSLAHYRYFPWSYDPDNIAAKSIPKRKGFNLSDIGNHFQSDNGLAELALQHYQATIDLSDDAELNARCLYLMAKCELNQLYNQSDYYDGYDGTVNEKTEAFKKSFKVLKDEYADTEFYDLIIQECSFFRHYTKL